MSHIAEQLVAETTKRRAPQPCIVARFVAERLDAEDHEVLELLLAKPRTGRIVHAVLAANGLDASASSVQNHIARRCACPQENTRS